MASEKGPKRAKTSAPAKSAAKTGVKIDEAIFSLPGMTREVVPKIVQEFLERIAPRLRVPRTSRRILEAFSGLDVKAETVARAIRENQYYQYFFLKHIEALSKRKDPPGLESAIVLLGMQNSRDLIVSLQLLRAVKGTHPEWTKEGKLAVSPAEVLKLARKTGDTLAQSRGGDADTAYTAALAFDWLAMIARELVSDAQAQKKVLAYLEQVYEHGMKTATIATEIATGMPEFGAKRYLFAACLLHDVGKVAMAALDPSYLAFVEGCEKSKLPRAVRLDAEELRFGVNHALLGGLILRFMGAISQIESAIAFHHDPYLLKQKSRDLWQLAAMVSLATRIANEFKRTGSPDDPSIATWKGPELRDFKVENRVIHEALGRLK